VTLNRIFDVFGIGNAMVDILAFVDDSTISDLKLNRGTMTLMNSVQQAEVLRKIEGHSVKLASGGSAANTMIAISQSGGTGYYTGKVSHDPHGEFYRNDMKASGIGFEVPLAPEDGIPTGSCVVLTTPDAERTMCTHLGVSTTLSPGDVQIDHLQTCKLAYIEGYLWDADEPRAACLEAMRHAKRLGIPVAFTFSDPFLIDRFADDFGAMTAEYCDILFCNADEARQFCHIDSLAECGRVLGRGVPLVFLTNSADGCYVIEQQKATHVPGFGVDAIDTVGAGDAFAGGVLFGLARGWPATQAARWGNFLASRVVAINGPRLPASLRDQMDGVLNGRVK
jgi:sugar/nucleoside kinase (ribokinase family)